LNNDIELVRPEPPKIFTFQVFFFHISGTAEARVFKFSTQTGLSPEEIEAAEQKVIDVIFGNV